jgi:hypothetical protein
MKCFVYVITAFVILSNFQILGRWRTRSLTSASSLVASVGNRDQWKNNGIVGLNGNNATARTDNAMRDCGRVSTDVS